MDWDIYCGPTPHHPETWQLWLNDEQNWQGHRWRGCDMWRSYSSHLMTNRDAHSVDTVQFAPDTDRTEPVEVWPLRESHPGDMRGCPVAMRYANGVQLWFVGHRSVTVCHLANIAREPGPRFRKH